LAQEEILGLKPRSPREPRPDSQQQLGQKRGHRSLHYHTPIRASSRIRFSGGTAGKPIHFVNDHHIDQAFVDIGRKRCKAGRFIVAPDRPPSS
jgi:hypothetical protein